MAWIRMLGAMVLGGLVACGGGKSPETESPARALDAPAVPVITVESEEVRMERELLERVKLNPEGTEGVRACLAVERWVAQHPGTDSARLIADCLLAIREPRGLVNAYVNSDMAPAIADALAGSLASVDVKCFEEVGKFFRRVSPEGQCSFLARARELIAGDVGSKLTEGERAVRARHIGYAGMFTAPYLSEEHRDFVIGLLQELDAVPARSILEWTCVRFDRDLHRRVKDEVLPGLAYGGSLLFGNVLGRIPVIVERWKTEFGVDPNAVNLPWTHPS